MERKLRYGIRVFLIISILVAGLHNTTVAQNHQEQKSVSTAEPFDIGYKIQGMSPQTASMIMYDKIPTLQNTGRLDLSIPIVHFDDPDFDFPISIRYNSEGFKPNEPDNYVGRDWSLECGGLIYREIKGKPDDMLPSPYTAGFLWNVESHRQNPETVKKDILSGSPLSYIGTHIVEDALSFKNNEHRGEFSSDIYHFCFGKHSGKFMIDFDGSVIVSGNDYGYTTFEKDPCFNSYSEALLSRIIFPTGGSLEIGYGQNEYSSYFVKNSESSFYKKLVDGNINYPCGGARVSRLQYNDSDMKQLKKVVYKYTAYPDEFKSSGILEFTPQYYHIWRTKNDPANNFDYYLLYSSDGFNTDDYTSPVVTYSTVTEYTTDTTVNTTSPRKFWFLSISPPETDKEISGTIELGIHNPLFPSMAAAEKELTRWTFRVELSQSKNCSGTISISKVGVGEVYKKVIRGDRNEYVRYYETINPVEKYGPGKFIVKIGKTGSSYVRFDQNLPNLSIENIDGYATITRYTDHHTNPDEYPDEKLIFQCRDYLHPASVLPVPELDEQYLRHNFLDMQDRSLERGKVQQQILLNRMGDTVQVVDYNYIRLEQPEYAIYASERPVIANAVTASLFVGINKEYFYCYKPSSCSVDTYDIDSKSMHNRCEYWKYDDKGYVRRHTLCINSKDMVEKYYIYCHDRDGTDKNFYGKIKEISEDLTGPDGRNMRNHIVYSYNNKGKIASVKELDSQDNVIKYEYFSHFDKYGNPTASESSTGLKCVYMGVLWQVSYGCNRKCYI